VGTPNASNSLGAQQRVAVPEFLQRRQHNCIDPAVSYGMKRIHFKLSVKPLWKNEILLAMAQSNN
jgi:hypothetical protein